MPFPRCKVRFDSTFGSLAREVSMTDPVTGVVSFTVEDCDKPLPDSRMFDISSMMKAGVTLNEVNTNILSSGIDLQAVSEACDTIKTRVRKKKQSATEEVANEDK